MAFPVSARAAEPPTGAAASAVTPAASAAPATTSEDPAPVSADVSDGDQGASNQEATNQEASAGGDSDDGQADDGQADNGQADDGQANTCMVKTICSVKQKIRWMTPAWTPTECQRIANAVESSSKRHDLSPTLLLAIMINESDMNEKAFRLTVRGGKVYAKDGGLMAIRCVLDRKEHCVNGNVRGMAWTINRRDSQGHIQQISKNGPCHHTTHAWWAHYNHGPRYIEKGYPRHYPHRIAVLDHALATVMNLDAPELKQRITIHDPGKRERTVDRPLEKRFKKLYNEILSSGSCSALAFAN
jgi:hypothetical protein